MPLTSETQSKHFVFVLMANFSMSSFAAAIEPLRIANRIGTNARYTWSLIGEGGEMATASNGASIVLNRGLEEISRNDTVLLCGGEGVKEATTKPLLNWLRREARKGIVIGGLCTAAYTMAKAGLLNGKKCTIHWENHDAFLEEFPDVEITKSIYVVDGNRYSSAGGMSSLDLLLNVIASDHSQELANEVADTMIYTSIRTDRDEQRLSIPTRIGVRHPKLSTVIQMMEANIEEPMSPSILAKDVSMSTRQLERLFRRYLNRSPKRYYMELRLLKARNLLMQTDMSVINVALACGFSSPSHFSKCYRSHYDTTPYRERGSQASLNK